MRVAGLRALVVSVGVAVLVLAAIASAATAPRTAAQNRAKAGREATTLLTQLVLPSWARSTEHEPAGDHRILATSATSLATPARVDRHGFWLVSSPLSVVEGLVAGHQRSSLKADGTGNFGGPGIPENESLTFTLSHPPPGIQSEALIVDMVALADGETGVRADAQVVWTVLRAATERVPSGVSKIDIGRGTPGQDPSLRVDVVAPSKVKEIVTMIDRLPVVQPGVFSCPAEPTAVPRVTFSFRAATDTVLATASEDADVSEPTGPCDALRFSVRGHAEPALLRGARFLHAVSRLVDVKLAAPAPAR